ncbi:hypothetical protein AVEN_233660-1 [Araneus ventricosus]|uniref:Mos1 transposase HTH domain-containing protein n=1 Tax=Araneus ventricosus TaxID=182803 RepID=A0A4Y2GKK1_ARAVE|nr:hypothetical protein AVEN_233660-1 [Araneus ventricosus]
MLKQVYGDDTVTLKTVYAWFLKVIKIVSNRGYIRRVRSHVKQSGFWFLLHHNARPHTATLAKRFLAQPGVTELSHPPYSPALSPLDFFLFSTL